MGQIPFAMFLGCYYHTQMLLHRLGEALNPDSAVPADAMSEEQTFRSEVGARRRLAPTLADIDHRWFKMKSKTYNGEVRRSEKDFETLQLGAFATPGLLLAQRPEGLTAESGFNLPRRRYFLDLCH
jgi:hypothetical protein